MRLDTSCTALENGRTGWSMVPRMKRWSHDGRPTEIQHHLAQVRGSAMLAPMAHLGTVPLDLGPLVFYHSPHSFLRTTWFPYPNRRCFQLLTILPLFCLTITSWAPATLSFLYFYGDGFQPFFSLGSNSSVFLRSSVHVFSVRGYRRSCIRLSLLSNSRRGRRDVAMLVTQVSCKRAFDDLQSH